MLREAPILPVPNVTPKIDTFGCPASRLSKSQELYGSGVKFFRKSSDDPHLGQITTEAEDRGFLIGVSQGRGHRRRIFHADHATTHDFDEGSAYVRNLSDDYRADLQGSFDFLLMEVSRPFLIELAEEHGWRGRGNLRCSTGHGDPMLSNLLRVVQPALAKSKEASPLFLDQLGTTIGIHLVETYAGVVDPSLSRGRPLLSRTQLAVATDMLQNNLNGNLPISNVAGACGLSRGYFIRAFKETTGETPHRWILLRRVERARELLIGSDLSLADIALTCGFADQSHFTRIFARMTGTPPGTWRRSIRM